MANFNELFSKRPEKKKGDIFGLFSIVCVKALLSDLYCLFQYEI